MSAEMIIVVGERVWRLTPAEARGVLAFFSEGAEGLMHDDSAMRGYIGDRRAVRAACLGYKKLTSAISETAR